MALRVIFMGSAELACPALRALCADRDTAVVGVVTQPDRPKGRNLAVAASSVKAAAAELGLPVFTPANVNTAEALADLRALRPDVLVVVAYGQILREPLLKLPARGCLNVHASLLPRYRGAAPIQWAIANGETRTGVTTMVMSARMDAGDILLQEALAIAPDDTAGSLQKRLAPLGAALLMRTLPAWVAGALSPHPQNIAEVTYAPKLHKPHGQIDWTLGAGEIYNRIRAFNPWPGCFCFLPDAGGQGAADKPNVLKVHRAAVEAGDGRPGLLLDVSGAGPLVATGRGALRLLEVQSPGGKSMRGDAYLRGRPLPVGARLRD